MKRKPAHEIILDVIKEAVVEINRVMDDNNDDGQSGFTFPYFRLCTSLEILEGMIIPEKTKESLVASLREIKEEMLAPLHEIQKNTSEQADFDSLMPEEQILAIGAPAEDVKDETESVAEDVMEKFNKAIEAINIPDDKRQELRTEFKNRASGVSGDVAKSVMGQLVLKAMKIAKENKIKRL